MNEYETRICPRLKKRSGKDVKMPKYMCAMCPYLGDDGECAYRYKFNPRFWKNKNMRKNDLE